MSDATVPEFTDGVFDDKQEVSRSAMNSRHTTTPSARRRTEIFMITCMNCLRLAGGLCQDPCVCDKHDLIAFTHFYNLDGEGAPFLALFVRSGACTMDLTLSFRSGRDFTSSLEQQSGGRHNPTSRKKRKKWGTLAPRLFFQFSAMPKERWEIEFGNRGCPPTPE